MTNSKTMRAVRLAAAALVVFIVVIGMGGALQAGLAPWPGIAIVVMAIAAFPLPREPQILGRRRTAYGERYRRRRICLIKTEFLTAISFPGPIFGIILGVPILGLAAAEAVGATRVRQN